MSILSRLFFWFPALYPWVIWLALVSVIAYSVFRPDADASAMALMESKTARKMLQRSFQ